MEREAVKGTSTLLNTTRAWLRLQQQQSHHPFCTCRVVHQNHYEVLGLKEDCSQTQVKEQFIRLSKEFHPDTNPKSSESHKQFVAINEAYSVLSKPGSRQIYDNELLRLARVSMYTYGDIRTNAPTDRVVFRDSSLYEFRDKSEFERNKNRPFYGVKGVQRLPNSYIAAGAVVFMVVGAVIHFFVAKTSSDFTIKQLDRRDMRAGQHHNEVREKAKTNGNELQIALLRQKIEEARTYK